MSNRKAGLGLLVLTLAFSKACFGQHEQFPLRDPWVTGAFMEYRETHFHGGIDLQPKEPKEAGSDEVYLVALGTLTYRYDEDDDVYRVWADHPEEGYDPRISIYLGNVDTQYDGLATRYLHLADYPYHDDMFYPKEGEPFDLIQYTRNNYDEYLIGSFDPYHIGNIVVPFDDYPDHLHFEVRDGAGNSTADYVNPLSYLPDIVDNSIKYVTADEGDPWTWTIIADPNDLEWPLSAADQDGSLQRDYDMSEWIDPTEEYPTEHVVNPVGRVRFLFQCFDRINTGKSCYLGIYKIEATLYREWEDEYGDLRKEAEATYSFTADRFSSDLYGKEEYIFNEAESVDDGSTDNEHTSTIKDSQHDATRFYYRLFAHDDANNLSVEVTPMPVSSLGN